MKAIIQQNNFPLSYGDDYPYMKYFVLIDYPNIEQLKEKIKGKEEDKKLFLTQKMMEYDENLSDNKFREEIEKIEKRLYLKLTMTFMNIANLSPFSIETSPLLGSNSPDNTFKNVDFPAPFAPIIP